MVKLQYSLFFAIIFAYQACSVHLQCTLRTERNGTITDNANVKYPNIYTKCWKIPVPPNHFVRLRIHSIVFNSQSCDYTYLKFHVNETREEYKICSNDVNRQPIIVFKDVNITLFTQDRSGYNRENSINLSFEVHDIECINKDSFRCTNYSCIPKDQVCDGVINCENGLDEAGCVTGILGIDGVDIARKNAINWLKSKRTPTWGWQENTERAVTALYLAAGANFNGSNLEEELMAKHTELKIAVALLKNNITNEQLSMFINALLVTCHNPRRFHGHDLVKQLKDQVEESDNFTHPIAYLALCNANESWPIRSINDLNKVLSSNSEYPFVRDIQAFAIMAISCSINNTDILKYPENKAFINTYKSAVKRLKGYQASDGSFGNVHTTALIMQALISSGEQYNKDWYINTTIKYLINELNSSTVDFLSVSLILPVLHGKSLSDIAKVNCSGNPRKHGEGDLISEMNDYLGPKMQVQYSLFVGNEKDVIHTIYLRVPENFTAYDVMQLAEVKDHKYTFEWKMISGKMYVYEIVKTPNDPEAGKFWLLYKGFSNCTEDNLIHLTSSPEEFILEDGEHLVMWYKFAPI